LTRVLMRMVAVSTDQAASWTMATNLICNTYVKFSYYKTFLSHQGKLQYFHMSRRILFL
jgi:hypothetical protein